MTDRATVRLANLTNDLDAIFAIRSAVFQIEQGVDSALEFDGKDEEAIHFLATLTDRPVGTARIRFLDSSTAKLERLAVLADARNQGIGKQIMHAAIAFLAEKNLSEIRIHAQEPVKEFYEQLGFVAEGDRFDEAGIPHIKMRKQLGLMSGRE